MLRKAGFLCVALAMFSIAGGHWAVLQSVAWAGMLADFTRESGSLLAGVEQTFDGEHPCELCKGIAVAKGQPAKSRPGPSSHAPDQKFKAGGNDGKCVTIHEGFQARLTAVPARWFAPALAVLNSRGEAPPVPPPRARAA